MKDFEIKLSVLLIVFLFLGNKAIVVLESEMFS